MQTTTVTAEIASPTARRIDEIASRLQRPAAWVIEQAVGAWIDREDEYHRRTLEGLADVDAGRVVDDEAVQAWANSLGTENPLPLPQPR